MIKRRKLKPKYRYRYVRKIKVVPAHYRRIAIRKRKLVRGRYRWYRAIKKKFISPYRRTVAKRVRVRVRPRVPVRVRPRVPVPVRVPYISSRGHIQNILNMNSVFSLIKQKEIPLSQLKIKIPTIIKKYYSEKYGLFTDTAVKDRMLTSRRVVAFVPVYIYKQYKVKRKLREYEKVYIEQYHFIENTKVSNLIFNWSKYLAGAKRNIEYSKKRKDTKVVIAIIPIYQEFFGLQLL